MVWLIEIKDYWQHFVVNVNVKDDIYTVIFISINVACTDSLMDDIKNMCVPQIRDIAEFIPNIEIKILDEFPLSMKVDRKKFRQMAIAHVTSSHR